MGNLSHQATSSDCDNNRRLLREKRISVDLMGADSGPHCLFSGVLKALDKRDDFSVTLHLTETVFNDIKSLVPSVHQSRIQPVFSHQVVEQHNVIRDALRSRKQSTMWCAVELVSKKQSDACVSCGNTGALMAIASFLLKPLPGITRPALAAVLPTQKTDVVLLDLGASVSCDADILHQFAIMGATYSSIVNGFERPRVALLNIGEEACKGNAVVKLAASLCRDNPLLNYSGYIEGNDIFMGDADVVVTDGFTGNVTLKTAEGLVRFLYAKFYLRFIRQWFPKWLRPLITWWVGRFFKTINPDSYNGASLVGLPGVVVKSHGNANSQAFSHAILKAVDEVDNQVPQRIKEKIEGSLVGY